MQQHSGDSSRELSEPLQQGAEGPKARLA